RRNNVESVRLPAPLPGLYAARIDAAAVVGDGVPGNGDPTDQDFALVLGNAEAASADGRVRLLGSSFRCDADLPLLVYDTGAAAHALRFTGLDACARYGFVVTAVDAAGNIAVSGQPGPAHAFATWGLDPVFREGFESGPGGFTHWGPLEEWEWGAPRDPGPAA